LLERAEDVARRLVQDLGAVRWWKLGPALEGLGGRLRGLVDIRRAAGRNLVHDLARGGVADLIRLSGSSLRPLVFDDHRCHSYLLSSRPTCHEGEHMSGVRLEKEGDVGRIVLDRPPANSYDYAFLREFASAIDEARVDLGIKSALVVPGAAATFFSAGAAVGGFAAGPP